LVAAHGHIQVSACGRELELEVQDAQPLATLQTSLRRELGLPGQELDISDVHGTRIVYDSDLRAALCRGDTPLSASRADSSTTCMEYRVHRNEDSGDCRQTQWKLIRDEFSSLADKMLKIGRSVEELSEAVGNQRREHDAATGHLWYEVNTLIETATRQSTSQIFDRIDALALSVQSEIAIREAMKDDLQKQLQVFQEDLEGTNGRNKKTLWLTEVAAGSNDSDFIAKFVDDLMNSQDGLTNRDLFGYVEKISWFSEWNFPAFKVGDYTPGQNEVWSSSLFEPTTGNLTPQGERFVTHCKSAANAVMV
jgi:hypothetical protein